MINDCNDRELFESQRILNAVLTAIPHVRDHHACGNPAYEVLSLAAKYATRKLFGEGSPEHGQLGALGEVRLPFTSMGAIKSTDLFGVDELMLFSYYSLQTKKYRRVADIGANIGLHSVILAKLGFDVECYEPDPAHIRLLRRNIDLNRMNGHVVIHEVAVSDQTKTVEFCRVLGNTTGSHIVGAKRDPYGELEKFSVPAIGIRDLIGRFDFLKIDVEGHEAALLEATKHQDWLGREAVIEIGSRANSARVFAHMQSIGVNMFPQKISWNRALTVDHLPTSHKEGSVFLSTSDAMSWQ